MKSLTWAGASSPPQTAARDLHRRGALVVLLLAHALRCFRFKNLAAAQAFEFIGRGRNRRLPDQPDAQRRLLLSVNLALQALGGPEFGRRNSISTHTS